MFFSYNQEDFKKMCKKYGNRSAPLTEKITLQEIDKMATLELRWHPLIPPVKKSLTVS